MNHTIDFLKASFKDFEEIPGLDASQRADIFANFTDHMLARMNFRFVTKGG